MLGTVLGLSEERVWEGSELALKVFTIAAVAWSLIFATRDWHAGTKQLRSSLCHTFVSMLLCLQPEER